MTSSSTESTTPGSDAEPGARRAPRPWLSVIGLAVAILALARTYDEQRPFQLVDARGAVRATLGVEETTVALELRDAAGRVRVRLAVDDEGAAQLALVEDTGASRASLSATADEAVLRLNASGTSCEIASKSRTSLLSLKSDDVSASIISGPDASEMALSGPGSPEAASRASIQVADQSATLRMANGRSLATLATSEERSNLSLQHGHQASVFTTESMGSTIELSREGTSAPSLVLTNLPGKTSHLPAKTYLGEHLALPHTAETGHPPSSPKQP